jgi:GNAT superfamily N-acetyltransferase
VISGFESALLAAYRERPCEVLPNALWKTLRMVHETGLSTDCSVDLVRNAVVSVEVYDSKRLVVHWEREPQPLRLDDGRLESLEFVLLHERHARGFPLDRFDEAYRSFRLWHRGVPGDARLAGDFGFRDAHPTREAEEVAALLRACYEGMTLQAETVRGWVEHPVHAPGLWVWVIDRRRGTPAALGIAELDESVPEASLEWIQVLPAYRRAGIASALICELQRRVEGLVAFTTVAGRVDNATHPEAAYRRCGFEGHDRFWVLRKGQAG